MRPAYIAVPLGLLMAAGGVVLFAASRSPIGKGPTILAQPRHPVTEAMWKQTDSWIGVSAPEFSVKDSDGNDASLASLTRGKPLFLYFVLDGCPCNIDAEPLFQRLYRHLDGKANFLAVTSSSLEGARQWKKDWASYYPVAPMPDKRLMKEYAVERSVYSVAIGPDGKIAKMWPGYSADMLQEACETLSKLANAETKPFDPLYAPKKMTSGCEF